MQERAMVVGVAGEDVVLTPKPSDSPSDKVSAQMIKVPGYFGYNVTTQLASEGIKTTLVTVLGGDQQADMLLDALREWNVCIHATRLAGRPSPSSHIVVSCSDGERVVYRTQGTAAEAWTEADIPWEMFAAGAFDWIAVGHLHSDWDGKMTCQIIQAGEAAGIPVSWTPGQTQIRLGVRFLSDGLRRVRLLVLNVEEAAQLAGSYDTSPMGAALELAAYVGQRTIVAVTDGKRSPAVCYDAERRVAYVVPPLSVKVVDPTGAGDAFHAGLAAGLVKGLPIEAALALARKKAVAVCGVWGGGLTNGGGTGEPDLLAPAPPIVAVSPEAAPMLARSLTKGRRGPTFRAPS